MDFGGGNAELLVIGVGWWKPRKWVEMGGLAFSTRKVLSIEAAALVVGFVGAFSDLVQVFIWFPTTVLHEVGHASAHWLTGGVAIPAYFVTLSFERSYFVALIVSTGLVALITGTKRLGKDSIKLLFCAFLVAQILLSYLFSDHVQEQVCIAAGLAAEAMLAPLFFWLSYEHLGTWWSQHRRIFSIVAILSLGNSLGVWIQIAKGSRELPYGSLLMGEEHGDINRLIDTYKWTESGLIWLFGSLVFLSFLTLVCIGALRGEEEGVQ